ncbi:hypothetical protein HUW63_12850 [Myxococcus sp. AM001]|nr:hypothetical protein [Myxococcus vastator]NVJ06118.1 hypothetical protein [Myxococcus sp. AM001]
MKSTLMKLFVVAAAVVTVGCGGGMEEEAPLDMAPQVSDEGGVAQQDLPVCGSGLYCSLSPVSGASMCVQTPTSTLAIYCCPSGRRIYHTSGGGQFCA